MSEQRKSLLVGQIEHRLSMAQAVRLREALEPAANRLGLELLFVGAGMKAEVYRDLTPLVEAIEKQTAAITALAESNRALVEAMAEADADDDDDHAPAMYLDGRRA